MDFLNEAFAALNSGVDRIFANPLETLLYGYAAFLVARARTMLLKGVPAWMHSIVASGIEQYLMPIVINAVKAAEEHGARLAKESLARGEAYLKTRLSAEKLAYARQYVLDRVPNWLVSDERLNKMIDAALVSIGKGAAKGVTIGVEIVEEQLGKVPPPPSPLPAA